MKRLIGIFLAIMMVMVAIPPVSVSAATLEEAVNSMTLTPMRETWPFLEDDTVIKRVDGAIGDKTTNYGKLTAVYNCVVNNPQLNQIRLTGNNCAAYARELYEELTVAGFKPYTFRGFITGAGGGWVEHSWVGIDVGNSLYFLDPFMSASGKSGYFLMPQSSATMYDLKNTALWQCDVGSGIVANEVLLSEVNTAAKRSKYGPVLDLYRETDFVYRMWGPQFQPGGIYEKDEYFITKDKRNNVMSIYRDGTVVVETQAEYDARRKREFEAWDREEARRQWNSNSEWVEKWGTYDEMFDKNGNMRAS